MMDSTKEYVSSASVQNSKADPQGYYYHVSVSSDIPGAKSSIEFDLKREVNAKFENDQHDIKNNKVIEIIKNYTEFKEFDCEQRTFRPADVTQILIYKTQGNIESMQPSLNEHAYKNSDKWNNLVIQHGELMNDVFEVRKPDPSLSDDFKFAKRQSMVNSIDNVYDFCKVMITLVSGFFAAYFALLKFLGVENALRQSLIPPDTLLIPPVLFVFSVGVFVFGAKPHIFFGEKFDDIERLKRFRNNIFWWKYAPMVGGMGLFIIGLGYTMSICLQILQSG